MEAVQVITVEDREVEFFDWLSESTLYQYESQVPGCTDASKMITLSVCTGTTFTWLQCYRDLILYIHTNRPIDEYRSSLNTPTYDSRHSFFGPSEMFE